MPCSSCRDPPFASRWPDSRSPRCQPHKEAAQRSGAWSLRRVDLVKDVKMPTSVQHFLSRETSRCTLFPPFYRRATWSVGRPGAAFSTPMSVALQQRFPRRRPPCPCCKFTSSTAISQKRHCSHNRNSRSEPSWDPPSWSCTLVHICPTVFEQRLSAGTRVTSHHGILHDFHHQLLHPAPLMNSPSSSTCSHLLLVTSSHLDFPGGVMNRLSSPVAVSYTHLTLPTKA